MDMIGRYEVKGELGRGGMAIVYRAIDPQIGREVAIKVLPREFMQEADFLSRFQREVRTVGQLTHAAIVPLYDAGQDNGQPYLVMRLMGGGSLLDRVKRGALSLAEVVAIFTRLGGALDEAHRKGVIHRDLKPGNILLDEAGLPYLSDFGIVKLTDATSMTSRGAIGTPAYMSPEHFHGKVNARSDVYAMGIILFQLLTGKLPFQAQTPPEYMRAHFMDVPPPLRSVNPNLPTALEPILQRALAKSDEARYGSVGELARALSEAVSQSASQPVSRSAGQPVSWSAGQPVSVQASFPWLWVGAGGVVLVLLLIILGLVGVVVSRSGTAVVERVVTATVEPPTDTPQIIADSPTVSRNPQLFADMILIPAGEFIMGSTQAQVDAAFKMCKKSYGNDCKKEWFEAEMPQHMVNLGEYFIDQYEVINAQYAECVKAGKCTAPSNKSSNTVSDYYENVKYANYPVIYVDWNQAKNYCEYVGKRLPTEAEWEKAARGRGGRIYAWGNEFDGRNLNFCDKNCPFDWADKGVDDGYADTSPVGSYELGQSVYGVYDMSGNVWEWTSSDYKGYPYIANDGREGLLGNTNKVLRGGSWGIADVTRVSSRGDDNPSYSDYGLGFRCLRSP